MARTRCDSIGIASTPGTCTGICLFLASKDEIFSALLERCVFIGDLLGLCTIDVADHHLSVIAIEQQLPLGSQRMCSPTNPVAVTCLPSSAARWMR